MECSPFAASTDMSFVFRGKDISSVAASYALMSAPGNVPGGFWENLMYQHHFTLNDLIIYV